VYQEAWCSGRSRENWEARVVIPINKIEDRSEYTYYRSISILSLPGKVHANFLEKRSREITEPKLEDSQCRFRPNRSKTEFIFFPQ